MTKEYFESIRAELCEAHLDVSRGKMMRSEAILHNNNVFAFLSQNNKMVFKLGKSYINNEHQVPIKVFSPFKNKAPMNNWYEVPYTHNHAWLPLAKQALKFVISNP